MRFKLPNSLKICLGTCMAALILGLQNIDEYCEQFESNHRDLVEAAEWVKNAAYSTGLPDLYEAERKLFATASRLLPSLGNSRKEVLPPVPKPKIVYVRVPALRQLNTFRNVPKEKESTLIPAELITEPTTDILQAESAKIEENTPTQAEPSVQVPEPSPETPEPQTITPATPTETPEPQPEQAVAQELTPADLCRENEQSPVHCRIMLLGDSLMEDLGPATHRTLRHRKGLHFILTAKYSTGLTRPEYFNWPKNMENAVAETRPDIIIFFIGANDGMPIKLDGRNVYPNSGEAWRSAYRTKMAELFEIGRRHNCKMIWVGLPPMGSRYAKILEQTAHAQREGCQEQGIRYIDTVPVLGDENGKFRTYMTDSSGKAIRLRTRDKEHLSPHGNKLVIEQLLPVLEQSIAEFRNKHPEKRLSEEEAARTGRAPLDITIKYAPGK